MSKFTKHRPNFSLTFLRTPELPARFAKFIVPLDMTKLDLRDFLYHCYNVRALSVRSYVYQRPVEMYEHGLRPNPKKQWTRRKALKYMIIEMDEPFVWPEPPSEGELEEKWDTSAYRKAKQEQEDDQKRQGMYNVWRDGTDENPDIKEDRQTLRKQAEELLAGKATWRPTSTSPRFTLPKHSEQYIRGKV